jgi:hypothetical protein
MPEYNPWNGGGGDDDDLIRLPGWLDRLICYVMRGICLLIVFGIAGAFGLYVYLRRSGLHANMETAILVSAISGIGGVIGVISWYVSRPE